MKIMRNNVATLYLVRHGETDWNKEKLVQGQTDTPLNETGINQAKEVAKQFKSIPFDLVFSSDLLRAKKTAEIIALEHQLAVQVTKQLRERRFGSLEGKPGKILQTYSKLMLTLNESARTQYRYAPEAENDEEFAGRLFTFLRETAIAYPGKHILVTTHSGVLRMIFIHLGIKTYEEFENLKFVNGGYIKLTSDGVDFFVNETHGLSTRQINSSAL